MKKQILISFVILSATVLFLYQSALAHKIRVFAYESGEEIVAEAAFSSGRPAKNSTVIVETDKGLQLLTGTTDDQGTFRFAIPEKAKKGSLRLNIIVDVGEGHRGSWLLEPADYLAETGTIEQPSTEISPSQQETSTPSEIYETTSGNCEQLALHIEQIVVRELAPIKRSLAENKEKKIDLQSILGGLGYILGLAGIAFYYKGKSNGDNR
jgi:nickel transport protein